MKAARDLFSVERYFLSVRISGLLLFFLFFCVSVLLSPALAEDKQLDVKRDEKRTVYTIDSSDEKKQEEAQERDKAWDMLRNMGIIIDKRSGQPAQGQATQPQRGK